MKPSNVVDLSLARTRQLRPAVSRLLAPCAQLDVDSPTEHVDPQRIPQVRELFELFGVTDLDPAQSHSAMVRSTLYELIRRISPHLRGGDPLSDAAFEFVRPRFHPAYDAYILALRTGDGAGVKAAAAELGIAHGIPPGSPWIAGGPLVHG
jgi:hypothetical protein